MTEDLLEPGGDGAVALDAVTAEFTMRSLPPFLLATLLLPGSLGAQELLYKHDLFFDFSLRDAEGSEVELEDFATQDVLLVFVPGPYDPALGEIRDRWAEFSRLRMSIRGVCLSSWEGLAEAQNQQDLPFPLLGNGRQLAKRLGITRARGPGLSRRAYLLHPSAYLEDWFVWDEAGIDRVLRSVHSSLHMRPPDRRPFVTGDGQHGAILVYDHGPKLDLDLELTGAARPKGRLRSIQVLGPNGERIIELEDRPFPATLEVGRRTPTTLEIELEVDGHRVTDRFSLHGLDEHAIFLGQASGQVGGLELEAAFWESQSQPRVIVRLFETEGRPQFFRNGRQGCTFGGGTHRYRDDRFNPRGQWGRGAVGCSIFRDERRRRPTSNQVGRWLIPPGGGAVRVYGHSVDRELPKPTRSGFLTDGEDPYAYDEEALEAAVAEWRRIKDLPENLAPARSPDGRPLLVEWSFHSEILLPQDQPPDWLPYDWSDVRIRFRWSEGSEPRVEVGA